MSELPPCTGKPNCVSTEATTIARKMTPIPFRGDPQAALDRLAEILGGLRGATITERGEHRLKAEVRSRLFGFVDDVEMRVDPKEGVIRFRSASRKGYWDLGVNRRRMARVREAFERG